MEILEENPFRRTSADVFWGRLSIASTSWLDGYSNIPERKQPDELEQDIALRLQMLSRLSQQELKGMKFDPFMGFQDSEEATGGEDIEGWNRAYWVRQVDSAIIDGNEANITTMDTIDNEIASRRVQGCLTPVSRDSSLPPSEMEWSPTAQCDVYAQSPGLLESIEVDSFEDLVHWEEDWTADVGCDNSDQLMSTP